MKFNNIKEKTLSGSQVVDCNSPLCSSIDLIQKAYKYSNNPKAFFDHSGFVVSVNPAFEKLFDIKLDQLGEKVWYELLHLQPGEADFDAIIEVITGTNDNCKFETTLQHSDNSPFMASIFAYGLKNLDNNVEFLSIELTKLSECRKDRKDEHTFCENNNRIVEYHQKQKLTVPILRNFSHEVRTSMNGIIGFSNIISSSDHSSSNGHLDIIKSCAYDLLSITENIIEIMQIETGLAKISPSLVNLNNLLMDIYSLIGEMNIKEISKLHFDKGFYNSTFNVLMDESRLRKVLFTILNSCVKNGYYESATIGFKFLKNNLVFFIFNFKEEVPDLSDDYILNNLTEFSAKLENNTDQMEFDMQIAKTLTEFMGGTFLLDVNSGNGPMFFLEIPFNTVN